MMMPTLVKSMPYDCSLSSRHCAMRGRSTTDLDKCRNVHSCFSIWGCAPTYPQNFKLNLMVDMMALRMAESEYAHTVGGGPSVMGALGQPAGQSPAKLGLAVWAYYMNMETLKLCRLSKVLWCVAVIMVISPGMFYQLLFKIKSYEKGFHLHLLPFRCQDGLLFWIVVRKRQA